MSQRLQPVGQQLGAAVEHATGLGATEAPVQPAPEAYRVMMDPDGHPFCLCPPAPES